MEFNKVGKWETKGILHFEKLSSCRSSNTIMLRWQLRETSRSCKVKRMPRDERVDWRNRKLIVTRRKVRKRSRTCVIIDKFTPSSISHSFSARHDANMSNIFYIQRQSLNFPFFSLSVAQLSLEFRMSYGVKLVFIYIMLNKQREKIRTHVGAQRVW